MSMKTIMDVSQFLFTDKPQGVSTHQVDPGKPGWLEYHQSLSHQRLWPIHRLDKTTSGCLAFAKSAEAADWAREQFANKRVSKRYVLITDKQTHQDQFEVFGNIEKNNKVFTFTPDAKGNSHTLFKKIKRTPFFEQWEALPSTGKPHQVRLHARHAGIPILGDTLYEGTPYPTLCLHSQKLALSEDLSFESPLPIYFQRMGLLRDPIIIEYLTQLDNRQRIFGFLQRPHMALRGFASDLEGSVCVLDILGPQLWLHCYQDEALSSEQIRRFKQIARLIDRPLRIRQRLDRGKNPQNLNFYETEDHLSKVWPIEENGYQIELRADQGASYGLFLDQRLNRSWVMANSHNRKVLNLFCYTSGFSVAALKGGAASVVSVDISKTYLEWSKQNVAINQLSDKKCQWLKIDASDLVKKMASKPPSQNSNLINRFNLVICDPPTFARTEKGVFKLDQKFEDLILNCYQILEPEGDLLISCNVESWNEEFILKKIQLLLPKAKVQIQSADLDYRLGHPHGTSKMFWVSKSHR